MSSVDESPDISRPFDAYHGDQPYIFVSYAHLDKALVYPELRWLHELGYRIWYDQGITPGSDWTTFITNAVKSCSMVLAFISPNADESFHVNKEITLAVKHKKTIISVHLVKTELTSGLELTLVDIQAIMRWNLADAEYRQTLLAVLPDILKGAEHSPTAASKPVLIASPEPLPAEKPKPVPAPVPKPAPPPPPVPAPVPKPVPQPVPMPPAPRPVPAPQPIKPVTPSTGANPQADRPGVVATEPLPDADQVYLNPADNEELICVAGETILLRYQFINSSNYSQYYCVDTDDEFHLPDGWMQRMSDQVAVMQQNKGELRVLIRPPETATAGEYPFIVFIGPQERPERRFYTLSVKRPAVFRITSETNEKRMFANHDSAAFNINIVDINHTASAFRVQCVIEQGAEHWECYLDQEVASCIVKGTKPKKSLPHAAILQARRLGVWWWGRRETLHARVSVVPVTALANHSEPENTVLLTVQRYRILPFPFFVIPLCFAVMVIIYFVRPLF